MQISASVSNSPARSSFTMAEASNPDATESQSAFNKINAARSNSPNVIPPNKNGIPNTGTIVASAKNAGIEFATSFPKTTPMPRSPVKKSKPSVPPRRSSLMQPGVEKNPASNATTSATNVTQSKISFPS